MTDTTCRPIYALLRKFRNNLALRELTVFTSNTHYEYKFTTPSLNEFKFFTWKNQTAFQGLRYWFTLPKPTLVWQLNKDMLVFKKIKRSLVSIFISQESLLYNTLIKVANTKQEEMRALISKVLVEQQDEIRDRCLAACSPDSMTSDTLNRLILHSINDIVAHQLFGGCIQSDSFLGTLQRTLGALEKQGESVKPSVALKQVGPGSQTRIKYQFFEIMTLMHGLRRGHNFENINI